MRQLARILGALLVVSGLLDFTFPWATARFFSTGPGADMPGPLPAAGKDLRQLSAGTLRYLALRELGTGALILWLSSSKQR